MRSKTSPRPEFGFTPAAASASACFSKASSKKTETAWPKMIGSDTFIIVAFMCNENKTPSSFALAISLRRKSRRADARMNVASTTVPGRMSMPSFNTLTFPSASVNSIFAGPAWASATVADTSFERKSLPFIEATCVFDVLTHSPIEWGFFIA